MAEKFPEIIKGQVEEVEAQEKINRAADVLGVFLGAQEAGQNHIIGPEKLVGGAIGTR